MGKVSRLPHNFSAAGLVSPQRGHLLRVIAIRQKLLDPHPAPVRTVRRVRQHNGVGRHGEVFRRDSRDTHLAIADHLTGRDLEPRHFGDLFNHRLDADHLDPELLQFLQAHLVNGGLVFLKLRLAVPVELPHADLEQQRVLDRGVEQVEPTVLLEHDVADVIRLLLGKVFVLGAGRLERHAVFASEEDVDQVRQGLLNRISHISRDDFRAVLARWHVGHQAFEVVQRLLTLAVQFRVVVKPNACLTLCTQDVLDLVLVISEALPERVFAVRHQATPIRGMVILMAVAGSS